MARLVTQQILKDFGDTQQVEPWKCSPEWVQLKWIQAALIQKGMSTGEINVVSTVWFKS